MGAAKQLSNAMCSSVAVLLCLHGRVRQKLPCFTVTKFHDPGVQEFLTATVFLGKLQRRENLMAAFQHFDTDSSGFISEEELLQVRSAARNTSSRSQLSQPSLNGPNAVSKQRAGAECCTGFALTERRHASQFASQ